MRPTSISPYRSSEKNSFKLKRMSKVGTTLLDLVATTDGKHLHDTGLIFSQNKGMKKEHLRNYLCFSSTFENISIIFNFNPVHSTERHQLGEAGDALRSFLVCQLGACRDEKVGIVAWKRIRKCSNSKCLDSAL